MEDSRAIARTFSLVGGVNSSRSTFDRYVGLTLIFFAISAQSLSLSRLALVANERPEPFSYPPRHNFFPRHLFSGHITIHSMRSSIIP